MAPLVRPLRMLGRYALYRPIASGGMATVHLGRLLGPVGFARTVAIKRLHENFARDPQFVAMFVDEARLAARIQHPNVVDMLDVITLEGELFLVLGYVQGESLATLFRVARDRGQPIPIGVLAGIIVGVLHGLHAAHEARSERGEPLGIVHRDVSPHNVLVGVDGVPKLLDFGVAKAAGRMQESRSGEIKGKLAYMAPEQTTGEADRRTDVYSTSAILWEGLTGRRLFSGENDAMLLRQVLAGKVGPPSLHAPRIPPELDPLVLRGLAAEPATRFATARDMARAVEQIVALASASTIGEWVEELARDSLLDRAKQIEIVEESSARLGALLSTGSAGPEEEADARGEAPSGDATRSLPGRVPSQVTPRDPDAMPTQLSSTRSVETRRSRLRRAGSLTLYGALAVAGFALWGTRRGAAPPAAAPPAAQASSTAQSTLDASPSAQPVPALQALQTMTDATAPSPAGTSSASRRAVARPPAAPAPARAGRDIERAIESRK